METPSHAGKQLTDEQQQLVIDNLPLIYFAAKRYRHIPRTSYEDLISRLHLRLCLCALDYDPSLGYKPSSYLVRSLQGEVKNFFRDEPWMVKPPRGLREKSFVDAEIDEETGLPIPRVMGENPETIQSCVLPTSLDEPLGEDGDTRIDLLASEERMDVSVVNRIGGAQILREIFRALRVEERYVLALQMKGKPLAELQARFGISRPAAMRVWEELREKVKQLYLQVYEGEDLLPSEGSQSLNAILIGRFVPPKVGFMDIRKRVLDSHEGL